jgi:DeoR/GlpR family transcriptional regulator of sugar metabolism
MCLNDHVQRSIRHKLIVQSVRASGHLQIDQLVELTGASGVTIRRDLAELEAHGSLRRTRGGASRAAKFGEDVPYRIRAGEDQQAKAALAEAAAALVADYDSLIIDNGTTCHAVAHELAGRPVTALCLSLHGAAALAAVAGARVIVPGGPVEADTLALYGSQAIDAVRDLRADVLVLGACSASATRGLTAATFEDAQLKRASLAAAAKRILVTTGAKLNQSSNFRFGEAADLTHLITTSDASPEVLTAFAADGVEIQVL